MPAKGYLQAGAQERIPFPGALTRAYPPPAAARP